MQFLVSLIIPVYNVEKYLRECLDSVIKQSYKNLEIILIDDGSSDGSGLICDNFATRYDNIRVVHQENKGVSFARNIGIGIARGEWVCFVDSDDSVLPDYVENLAENANSENIDFVISGRVDIFLDGNDNELYRNNYSLKSKILFSSIKDFFSFFTSSSGIFKINTPWAKLFRLSKIIDNNLCFNESMSYGEDWDFCLNYIELCNTIVFTGKSLYNYMHRANRVSLVSADILIKYPVDIELHHKLTRIMEQKGCSDKDLSNANKIYFGLISSRSMLCINKPSKSIKILRDAYKDKLFIEGMEQYLADSKYTQLIVGVFKLLKPNAICTWLALYCLFLTYRVFSFLKRANKNVC